MVYGPVGECGGPGGGHVAACTNKYHFFLFHNKILYFNESVLDCILTDHDLARPFPNKQTVINIC